MSRHSFDTATDTFWPSQQSLSFSAEIKAALNDPLSPDVGLFLYSHNDVLGKHYCHYLPLRVPASLEDIQSEEKIEDAFEVVREAEEREVDVKMMPFSHCFALNGRSFVVTGKGLFGWEPRVEPGPDQKAFTNQILINQVELMQSPI